MSKGKILFLIAGVLIALSPVFAQESSYINLNRNPKWEKTSDGRLIDIIKNPSGFTPEEFMSALHEYAIKHGKFNYARDNFEAMVNAYIAFNPGFMNQSSEEIFVWTGKSRGVKSFQGIDVNDPNNIITDGDSLVIEDYVYYFLDRIEEGINPLVFNENGIYEDGASYVVYRAGADEDIEITVSTDRNGKRYLIAKAVSQEAMDTLKNIFCEQFSEPVSSIGGDFSEKYHDGDNQFIKENMPDYFAIFTVSGDQVLIEEVIKKEKNIIQTQFCTAKFFEQCNAELGPGWGFTASWIDKENEE